MASFFQGGGRVVAVFLRRGAQTPLRTQSRRFSPMAWYNSQLEKAPVITKSITSGSKPACIATRAQSLLYLLFLFLSFVWSRRRDRPIHITRGKWKAQYSCRFFHHLSLAVLLPDPPCIGIW